MSKEEYEDTEDFEDVDEEEVDVEEVEGEEEDSDAEDLVMSLKEADIPDEIEKEFIDKFIEWCYMEDHGEKYLIGFEIHERNLYGIEVW